MAEIHNALEHCLKAIENGATLDHAVRRYPQLEPQLRPLLVAALRARDAARVHVPLDVRKRARQRLLQRAYELEERRFTPRKRIIPMFPRMAITAILAAVLVLTSTGLVSASSSSLPGQQLYPVKRTWENLRLWFVFTPEERDLLESDYEQERLNEIYELLGKRMEEPISFSGLLSKQSDGSWTISGIPVAVLPTTALPSGPLSEGVPLTVVGVTGADGLVQAHRIVVLQPGSSLPPLEPSQEGEHKSFENNPPEGASPTQPALAAPSVGGTVAGPLPGQKTYEFSGVVQSMQGNVWRINGQTVYVDLATVDGQVKIGSIVKFQGFYSADGRLMVTSIQPRGAASDKKEKGGSDGGGGGGDGGGEGEGGD